MKNLKKGLSKFVIAVFAFIMAVLPLSGCKTGKSKGDITVMLLTNAGSELYYKNLFKQIGNDMGIEINFIGHTFQNYKQMLQLEMQNEAPDVFYVNPEWIKSFVADDLLAELDSYIKENVDSTLLLDTFNQPFRYDGKDIGSLTGSIYAVNGGFSYQGLAYNKKIIKRLEERFAMQGIKTPDQLGENETYTWSEFATVLEIVNGAAAGGATGSTSVIGMDMPSGTMLLQVLMNFGADILKDGVVNVKSAEAIECMQWLYDQKTKGNIGLNASFPEWNGQSLAFYSTSGSWEMAPYGEITDSSLLDANVNFMPWPTKTGKYEDTRALIDGAGYAVYKHSKNIEVAKEVATYFMQEKVLDDLCLRGYGLPMTKKLSAGEYLSDSNFHPDLKAKQFLIDVISGKVGEFSPLDNGFSREWYDITLLANIDEIWNGSKTPKQYLDSKQSEVQARYDFYNKN